MHDKAILDEDDVANAHVIVYGEAADADFKRFGPRSFLTPGPVAKGAWVASACARTAGSTWRCSISTAQHVLRESMAPTLAKMVVASS